MHSSSVGDTEKEGDGVPSSTATICAVCTITKGAIAGTGAKFFVYPLDRIKMIHQVKSSAVGSFHLHLLFKELNSVIRNEGAAALWKGYLAGFGRTFTHSGIIYLCFDFYQQRLVNLTGSFTIGNALAGGCAGFTGTMISYPLDVCNTRMAVSNQALRYKDVTLIGYEGIRSLYRGSLTTCFGIFPYAGCSFCTYEMLKYRMREWSGSHHLSPFGYMLCGGLAGVVSQTVTYPIDTIRKFLQVNTFLYRMQEGGYSGKHHPSIKEAIQHIYRASGIRGFYNGVSINWFKGFLGPGISFMLHEQFKRAIETHCPQNIIINDMYTKT